MGRRVIAVLLAAVIAIFGAAAVFIYARGADARAIAGADPRTVYVSEKPVSAGTSLADAVRDRALVIYELNGEPLPEKSGGPFRFLIPDHTACHTSEVDECANVKYIDRIELSAERGQDNRPKDDDEHAKLHKS